MTVLSVSCQKEDDFVESPVASSGIHFSQTTTDVVAVDMGLSVLWASQNIGSDTADGFGFYYSFGETEPKAEYNASNGNYRWGDYNTEDKENRGFTKYNNKDGKLSLDPSDDPAIQNWKGKWRLPTVDEYAELFNNKEIRRSFGAVDGIYGWTFKSYRTGNTIFIPLAGYMRGKERYYRTDYGYYLTSECNETDIWYARLAILTHDTVSIGSSNRYDGFSVRPVREY